MERRVRADRRWLYSTEKCGRAYPPIVKHEWLGEETTGSRNLLGLFETQLGLFGLSLWLGSLLLLGVYTVPFLARDFIVCDVGGGSAPAR